MKTTVTEFGFLEAFNSHNRSNNFTPEALRALFEFFEDMESGGEEIELDVIAICCEFSQSSVQDIMSDYQISLDDLGLESDADIEDIQLALEGWLNNETIVVGSFDDHTICYGEF